MTGSVSMSLYADPTETWPSAKTLHRRKTKAMWDVRYTHHMYTLSPFVFVLYLSSELTETESNLLQIDSVGLPGRACQMSKGQNIYWNTLPWLI